MIFYLPNATLSLTLTEYRTIIPKFSLTSCVSSTPGGKLHREKAKQCELNQVNLRLQMKGPGSLNHEHQSGEVMYLKSNCATNGNSNSITLSK